MPGYDRYCDGCLNPWRCGRGITSKATWMAWARCVLPGRPAPPAASQNSDKRVHHDSLAWPWAWSNPTG